jgi:hypothetical protein
VTKARAVLDKMAKLVAGTLVAPWVIVTPVEYRRSLPVIVITVPPPEGTVVGVKEVSVGGTIVV